MKMLKTIVLAVISVMMLSSCGEREGTVSTHDCREQIQIKETSFHALTKTFTCEYIRTRQGRLMSATCVHIDYDNNGQCKASFTYFKKQDNVCLDKATPRLGMDDFCYPN
jgi:hypothetical protein